MGVGGVCNPSEQIRALVQSNAAYAKCTRIQAHMRGNFYDGAGRRTKMADGWRRPTLKAIIWDLLHYYHTDTFPPEHQCPGVLLLLIITGRTCTGQDLNKRKLSEEGIPPGRCLRER